MSARATPILSIGLVWLLAIGGGRAQESPPTEYQLKAAFLLNFARFVEWPQASYAETNSDMILGILGKNPFGDILQQMIQGKTINSHPLVVTNFDASVVPTKCHILFINETDKDRLKTIIEGLRKASASVLTVGETVGFTENGGMIGFFEPRQGNAKVTKIRFQINEQAARDAHLKISSKLLSLASR